MGFLPAMPQQPPMSFRGEQFNAQWQSPGAQLDSEAQEFLPGMPQQLPVSFSGEQFNAQWQLPPLSPMMQALSPMMQAAQPLPLLLESLVSLQPVQEVQQEWPFDEQLATSAMPPPPLTWATQSMHASTKPELGSPEFPSLGSEGHQFGQCRPCAFLFTKGCSNGASCSFCHLCDAGEKKRRTKDKRAAIKNARQFGCSELAHLK